MSATFWIVMAIGWLLGAVLALALAKANKRGEEMAQKHPMPDAGSQMPEKEKEERL